MPSEYLDPVVAVLGGDSAPYMAMLAEAEARMEGFVAATTAQIAELDARLGSLGAGTAGEAGAAAAAAEAGAVGGTSAAAAAAVEEEAAAARIVVAEESIAAAAVEKATKVTAANQETSTSAERTAAEEEAANTKITASTVDMTAAVEAEVARLAKTPVTIASAARTAASEYAVAMDKMLADTARVAASFEAAEAKATASTALLGARLDEAAAASSANVERNVANATASFGKLGVASSIVAVGVGVATVKMAGDFEQASNRLVTAAGESESNMGQVRDGILGMAGSVGFSAQELAQAMYTVDSASFHGADSLTILKAAAQGARIEQADLGTTVDAVTTSLVDYHMGADQAATVMSKLVTAVGEGKTNLQELAGSLHSVTPLAANLGITLDEVTAAVATMTVHGMGADQATQNLADTIRHLANPTQTMVSEMGQLGLSAADLSRSLSDPSVGLHGVLEQIYTTIMRNMGPAGSVLLNTFKQSTSAGDDLKAMLAAMPGPLKDLANGLEDGSLSLDGWRKGVKALPADMDGMASQFLSLFNKANGFNDALKAGSPAAQTFTAALAKVMGDSTGLNTALMLGGENAQTFANNIDKVSSATADGQGNVKNWSDVANTLNQKLADVEGSLSSLAVKLGNDLLPAVKNAADGVGGFVDGLNKNKDAADELGKGLEGLGTVGLLGLTSKLLTATSAFFGLGSVMSGPVGAIITGTIAGIVHDVPAISKVFSDSKGSVDGFFKAWHDDLMDSKGDTNLALDLFGNMGALISDFTDGSTQNTKDMSTAWGAAFTAIDEGFQSLFGPITHSKDLLNDFSESVGQDFGSKIAQNMRKGLPQAQAAAMAVSQSILDAFKNNDFKLNGQSTVDDFSSGMRDAVGAALDAASAITGSIKTAYELFDPSPEGKKVAESFGAGIKTGRQAVDAAGQEGLSSLITILAGGGGLAKDAGHLTSQGLADGILVPMPQVDKNAGQLVSHIEGPLGILTATAYGSGLTIGSNLAAGMQAQQAHVAAAAAGLANTVRSHLPSSPAKKGPLSGSGSPDILGRNISTMIADGVLSGHGNVANAMSTVLSTPAAPAAYRSTYASAIASGAAGAGNASGFTVNVTVNGSLIQQQDLRRFLQDVFLQHEARNNSNGLSGVMF